MKMINKWAVFALALGVSNASHAVLIDFTGGTAFFNGGGSGVTDNNTVYQNVQRFEDQGFQMEFIFGSTPSPFATIVGDYYNTSNDVIHYHWADADGSSGSFGEVTEMRVSRIDGGTFDLGGFRVSTNTSRGGGSSSGGEMTWINSSLGSEIFMIPPDSWGLGSGPDPLVTIASTNTLFDDITWFSFTNDARSTAVGMGLDNFFLDEPGDPGGSDPTVVPVPATLALFGLGLAGLGWSRRKKA